MSGWKTLSSEIVYETHWIKIRRDEVLNQNGDPLIYSYMELQHPSIFIVAVNEKHEVLLQSVYRYTIKQRLWEIPAGMMETDEKPIAAAKRELQEETGLVSDDWQNLGKTYQIAGTGNVPLYTILAKNVRQATGATDKDEDIKGHRFVSRATIEQMIKDGEFVDSPAVAAIYIATLAGI